MKIHLMGIAGTGMGAFAGLLKQAGHDVVGSDENVYPPMSDKLRDWQIPVRTPYSKDNLNGDFDLVVVGNVIRKDNVEAVAMRERQLHHASFPATLGQLFLKDRHSVVVAGTHGKTTTSTLLAWLLALLGACSPTPSSRGSAASAPAAMSASPAPVAGQQNRQPTRVKHVPGGGCEPEPSEGSPCAEGDNENYCVLSWGEPGGSSWALWCRHGKWEMENERNLPKTAPTRDPVSK